MKKLLILAGVIALTMTQSVYAKDLKAAKNPPKHPQCERKLPPCMGQPEHRPPFFDKEKFEKELNLTDTQKEQLEALKAKQMEASKPIFEELKAKETEVKELKSKLREIHVQNKQEFRAILTEEQAATLDKIKAEKRAEFKKNHRRHHGMPPRPVPVQPACKCDK